jgi:hypothetical protein
MIASPRKPADGTEQRRVERPFSDIRLDFFLARSFRNLKNLKPQLDGWLAMATNVRLDGATQRSLRKPWPVLTIHSMDLCDG